MNDQRGFTLIEILVAVAIMTGAMLAVSTMSLTSYERVARSGHTTSALTSAQQRMEWLRSQAYDSPALIEGTTTEVLSGSLEGYTRATIVRDDTPTGGVKELTITVMTPTGRRVQLVSLLAGE